MNCSNNPAPRLSNCEMPDRRDAEAPTFVKLHDMQIDRTELVHSRELRNSPVLSLGLHGICDNNTARIDIPCDDNTVKDIAALLDWEVELYIVRKGYDADLAAHLMENVTGASLPYIVSKSATGETLVTEIPEDVAAREAYVRPRFKGDLAPYATGGKLIDTVRAALTPEGAAQAVQDWRATFRTGDLGKLIYPPVLSPEEKAKFAKDLEDAFSGAPSKIMQGAPVDEEGTTREPYQPQYVTCDIGTQAYTAASLMRGNEVLTSAVNVYRFDGALRNGTGKRARTYMLFELAEVVPVSNLHVAVDRMTTHYFENGTFDKRAFNAKNVRPANTSEVGEYLQAKYQYELKNK